MTVSPIVADSHSVRDINSQVAQVSVTVRNTGTRDGTEVVQLYLSFPHTAQTIGEPPKQLKAFSKIAMRAGQSYETKFTLTLRDLSTWDSSAHVWSPVKGEFGILVGASSADILLTGNFVN